MHKTWCVNLVPVASDRRAWNTHWNSPQQIRHHPKYLCPNMPSKITDQRPIATHKKTDIKRVILEKWSSSPNSCFCLWMYFSHLIKNIRLSHKFNASTFQTLSVFSKRFSSKVAPIVYEPLKPWSIHRRGWIHRWTLPPVLLGGVSSVASESLL